MSISPEYDRLAVALVSTRRVAIGYFWQLTFERSVLAAARIVLLLVIAFACVLFVAVADPVRSCRAEGFNGVIIGVSAHEPATPLCSRQKPTIPARRCGSMRLAKSSAAQ